MSHRKKNKHKPRHRTHTVKPANLAAPASLPAPDQPVAVITAENLSPEPAASSTDE